MVAFALPATAEIVGALSGVVAETRFELTLVGYLSGFIGLFPANLRISEVGCGVLRLGRATR